MGAADHPKVVNLKLADSRLVHLQVERGRGNYRPLEAREQSIASKLSDSIAHPPTGSDECAESVVHRHGRHPRGHHRPWPPAGAEKGKGRHGLSRRRESKHICEAVEELLRKAATGACLCPWGRARSCLAGELNGARSQQRESTKAERHWAGGDDGGELGMLGRVHLWAPRAELLQGDEARRTRRGPGENLDGRGGRKQEGAPHPEAEARVPSTRRSCSLQILS